MKAGYKGDGDWMGADRDSSNDDYAPDFLSGSAGGDVELFNALAVLERHLSSSAGGRRSDDHSPDQVAAALAQLERAVARGRRYGMYGLYGLSTTAADGDDDAGVPAVEPEMVAAVELIKRGLRRKATSMVDPDSDDGGADISAGLGAVALLKRKAKAALGPGRDDDSVEGELRRARQGVLVSRDSDDELMLAMKDLTTSAHQRRAKCRPGRGSHGVRAGYDDDQMLVEAMHGLLARRRPPKGKGAAAKEGDDDFEPLAAEITRLAAQHRAKLKSKGSVAVGRDTDDAALIDGVSDVLGRWQAKPRASEEELLARLSEWIDTDEPRRRRAEGSAAVRDEDDVLLIDSLSGLIAHRRAKAAVEDAAAGAKRRGKGSIAVRPDGIDEMGGMGGMAAFGAVERRPRRGRGSVAVRPDGIDDMAEGEESTLNAMAGLLEQLKEARRGRGSVAAQPDENEDIIDAMLDLMAEQNKIRARLRGGRGSVAVRPDSMPSAFSSMDATGEGDEARLGAVEGKKRGGRGSDAARPDGDLDEGGYDRASADLEESNMLGAMPRMVYQMWVRKPARLIKESDKRTNENLKVPESQRLAKALMAPLVDVDHQDCASTHCFRRFFLVSRQLPSIIYYLVFLALLTMVAFTTAGVDGSLRFGSRRKGVSLPFILTSEVGGLVPKEEFQEEATSPQFTFLDADEPEVLIQFLQGYAANA